MPLLISPIDGSPMRQVHRLGIEFDVCPTSGGVWLDRGELDKLIALVRNEAEAELSAAVAPAPEREPRRPPERQSRQRWDDDDDDDDDRYRRGKRGGVGRLLDIFDF